MPKRSDSALQYDYLLFISVFLLLCIGLVFVYSASSNLASYRFGDPYMYLKKQALFCLLGIIVMIFAMHIPLSVYADARFVYSIFFLSLALLFSLFFIGHTVNGATRWIRFGHFSFQPSELAKFSLCLYLSYSMVKKGTDMKSFKKGLLPHLLITAIFITLIMAEPDRGTALMIALWLFIVLFVGGCRISHLILTALVLFPFCLLYLSSSEYVLNRWKAFLNPWAYPDRYGFQIIHSLYAFGTGGLFGVGLGNGKQKLFYLPEPHTDFILPVIGEEIGFIGIAFIIFLYIIMVTRGIKISINTNNLFGRYLAFGITSMIALQILINIAVVMNLLPAKGLTLPFLSYGGSSLLITMMETGILLNVSSKR